eukprot:CAMPEP_0119342454 /NCGR_PEP_ID=MMETSP1333-20130426/104780_1 /TAXON_ID=418940 /ORGANISM="Scyphosphaera apsteinii, Strain RCC1455" /LENGTH=75 /DNA_ID=CAMNT_0007354675 /DNA_START=178 /DNA_END=406 /DNA_ORIENTATION=-
MSVAQPESATALRTQPLAQRGRSDTQWSASPSAFDHWPCFAKAADLLENNAASAGISLMAAVYHSSASSYRWRWK